MFYKLLSKLEQRNCVCFVYHLLFLVECNCMEENKPILNINTDRFKNTFVNRLVFKHNLVL